MGPPRPGRHHNGQLARTPDRTSDAGTAFDVMSGNDLGPCKCRQMHLPEKPSGMHGSRCNRPLSIKQHLDEGITRKLEMVLPRMRRH